MKNFIFFLILSTFFLGSLAAQVEISITDERIVFLNDGTILKGIIEEVDIKTVRISKDNESFTIPKLNIEHTLVTDVTVGDDIEDTESLIIFKNKNWIKAQIFQVSKGSILIKGEGKLLHIATSDLLKVYPTGQEFEKSEEFLRNEESFTKIDLSDFNSSNDREKVKRIYNITTATIKPRLTSIRDGLGIQHTTGFRFNQYLGVGLNAGFTNYAHDFISILNSSSGFCIDFCNLAASEIKTVSMGLSLRGELNKKKIRPFYNIDFGFTKTIRSEVLNQEIAFLESISRSNFSYDKRASKPKLGYILQPSFGIQTKMKTLDILFDLGFQFGLMNFESGFQNVLPDQSFFYETQSEKIRGVVLRVGILL